MPQSLANILVHVIFSTKGRNPLINDSLRSGLHAYMVGILQELDSPALIINSVADHAHILCSLSKNLAACKLVEEVKKSSTEWIKPQGVPLFAWQNGYGVFAVSQSNADSVRAYISNQEAHHRSINFQDEFRQFLDKYQVQYDECYVWD
ncbi:MAG: Transposase [Pedosphaera sp.]|nr:Transposase [Pedosphaera sp.]